MRYRKLRMQDMLREEIASILQRDMKDPGIGFTTIVEVKMSDDLKYARVFCSVYGNDEAKNKTMEALKRSRGYIKFLLGQRIKIKYMPDINFVLDNTQEKVARIEDILKKVAHAPED
ncbi:MAG TPA: 30S ribosome-binding factor RbfA [Deltaproteobacteria bacterium]|jgi:ribosome-binding factor A|nr:30S ribosome-binding factor RbfA [Deltaproteobacteria bacterium]